MGSSKIIAAEPQLFVTDLAGALVFYVDKLGFVEQFSYGEPAFYAQVARDGGRLNLRKVEGPVYDGNFLSTEPDPLSAVLTLEDSGPLFREYDDAGVRFHQRLRVEPWGSATFIVADPDGNLIAFSGTTASGLD